MLQCMGISLVQALACRLFGAKPLPELMLEVNWTQGNTFHLKCIWMSYIFIRENVYLKNLLILLKLLVTKLAFYEQGYPLETREETIITPSYIWFLARHVWTKKMHAAMFRSKHGPLIILFVTMVTRTWCHARWPYLNKARQTGSTPEWRVDYVTITLWRTDVPTPTPYGTLCYDMTVMLQTTR